MAAAASEHFVEFVGSRQSPGSQPLGPWTLNSGPFPPPALPGFDSTTNPSATLTRPGLSLMGVRLRGTPPRREGLPVLRWISCAGMLPPIPRRDRWVESLMGRRIPAGLLLTSDGGLPQVRDGSAPTTKISGPHRKFTCVAACLLAGPQNGPLDQRLRRLRYRHRRSTAAPIATGWSDPGAGRELHPLKILTFSRRTLTPLATPRVSRFRAGFP
jgi:hypothetical protein